MLSKYIKNPEINKTHKSLLNRKDDTRSSKKMVSRDESCPDNKFMCLTCRKYKQVNTARVLTVEAKR